MSTLPHQRRGLLSSIDGSLISNVICVCMLAVLMWLRLGVGIQNPGQTVFGDTGDGYFNAWILEHVRLQATHGWQALSDGRILHPADNTFWWSDNLFTLSPPYLVFRAMGASILTAIYWTTVFWMILFFFAAWALFSEVRKSLYPHLPKLGNTGSRLSSWLALLLTFLPARLSGLQHFQNHTQVFWILLLFLGIRFFRTRSIWMMFGQCAAMVALLASAPYYAILGFLVCLAFGISLLISPPAVWKGLLTPKFLWVGLILIPALPFLYAYLQVESPSYTQTELIRGAWKTDMGLIPVSRRESHGYPGFILLCTGVIILIVHLVKKRSILIDGLLSRKGLLFSGLLLLTLLKVKEIYPVTAWIRILLMLWFLKVLLKKVSENPGKPSQLILYLGLIFVFVSGTAMGPGTFFGDQAVDPSIWGIFSHLVPGYTGMRHLVRFTPMAAAVLMTLVYAGALSLYNPHRQKLWNGLATLFVLLTLVDPWTPTVPFTKVDPATLSLNADQDAFFQSIEGVMLEIPAAPFHRNPEAMLRWQPYTNLRLINGYTGRQPEHFSTIIRNENHHGRGSPQQITTARALGADWICIRRAWVPNEMEMHLSNTWPAAYEDDRFLVLKVTRDRQGAAPNLP